MNINSLFRASFAVKEADILAHRTNAFSVNVHSVAIGSLHPSSFDDLDGNFEASVERLEFQKPGIYLNDGPLGAGVYFAQVGTCKVSLHSARGRELSRIDKFNTGILFISGSLEGTTRRRRVVYQGRLKSSEAFNVSLISQWLTGVRTLSPQAGEGAIELVLETPGDPSSAIINHQDFPGLFGGLVLHYKRGEAEIIQIADLDPIIAEWEVGNLAIITRDYTGPGAHLSVYFNDDELYLGNDSEYDIVIGTQIITSNNFYFTQNRQQAFYESDNVTGIAGGQIASLRRNGIVIATATVVDYGTPTGASLRHIRLLRLDDKLLTQDGICNIMPGYGLEFHGPGDFPSGGSQGTMFDIILTDLVGEGDFLAHGNGPFDGTRPFVFPISSAAYTSVQSTTGNPNNWDGSIFYIALQGTNFVRLFIPTNHADGSFGSVDTLTIEIPAIGVNLEQSPISNIDVFQECSPRVSCPQKQPDTQSRIPTMQAYAHAVNRHADNTFPYVFDEYLKLAQVAPQTITDTSVDGRNALFVTNYTDSIVQQFIINAAYHESGMVVGLTQDPLNLNTLNVKLRKLYDVSAETENIDIANPIIGAALLPIRPVSDGKSLYYLLNDSGLLYLMRMALDNGTVSLSIMSTTFNNYDISNGNLVTLSYGIWGGIPCVVLTGAFLFTPQVMRTVFDPVSDSIITTNMGQTITPIDFSAQTIQVVNDEFITWFINWTVPSANKLVKTEIMTQLGDTSLMTDYSASISDSVNAKNLFAPIVSNDRFIWLNFAAGDNGVLCVFDRLQQLFSGALVTDFVPQNGPLGKPTGDRNSVYALVPRISQLANVSVYTIGLVQPDESVILPTQSETGVVVIGTVIGDASPGDYDVIMPFDTNDLEERMIPAGAQLMTGYNPCDGECGTRQIIFTHFAINPGPDLCAEA